MYRPMLSINYVFFKYGYFEDDFVMYIITWLYNVITKYYEYYWS